MIYPFNLQSLIYTTEKDIIVQINYLIVYSQSFIVFEFTSRFFRIFLRYNEYKGCVQHLFKQRLFDYIALFLIKQIIFLRQFL
jgi:hypothetical protein